MNDDIDRLVAAHRAAKHAPPSHVVQQWHDAIDNAAAAEDAAARRPRRGPQPGSFFAGMAVAATLVLGVAIGYFIAEHEPGEQLPLIVTQARTDTPPASLTRGLRAHFASSRAQLADLPDSADRTLLVIRLIEQNRMFETAAVNNDADDLARVLRAFEPILLRLAADDLGPEDARALQEQLAFEMNVMLTKLAVDPSDQTETT